MAGMMRTKLGQKKGIRMGVVPAAGAGASPMPMMNKGGKMCMKGGGKAKKMKSHKGKKK